MAMGFGLHATPSQAFYLFRHPNKLFRSLFAINLVMLLFAVLVALWLDLPPYVDVTLLALAVSPLPPLFPGKSLKAGGREKYIIGLLVAICLFSIVLMPLALELLESIFHKPVQINAKGVVVTALLTLIIPLFLGITLHHVYPGFADKVRNGILKTGQILLFLVVIPILIVMFPTIKSLVGNGTLIALAGFVLVGLVAGHLLGGPDKEDRTVLALASATRHPGIAIAVAAVNFQEHKQVLGTIVLYLLVSAVVGLPYLKWAKANSAGSNPDPTKIKSG